MSLTARYSIVHNVTPGGSNYIACVHHQESVAGVLFDAKLGSQALVPVVYSGVTPYITWNIYRSWIAMAGNNANYIGGGYLYLLGVVV